MHHISIMHTIIKSILSALATALICVFLNYCLNVSLQHTKSQIDFDLKFPTIDHVVPSHILAFLINAIFVFAVLGGRIPCIVALVFIGYCLYLNFSIYSACFGILYGFGFGGVTAALLFPFKCYAMCYVLIDYKFN